MIVLAFQAPSPLTTLFDQNIYSSQTSIHELDKGRVHQVATRDFV
jgi:hypothetical protein